VASGSRDGALRVWDPSTGECLDVLETTEVDVSHMDFSDAILTEDVARLLWHGRATISDADYERYVKPYRKPYHNDEHRRS
jgi:WD40 repeat protein